MYTAGVEEEGRGASNERGANKRETNRQRDTWVFVEGDDLVQRQVEGLLRAELDGHHRSGDGEGRPGQHCLRDLGLQEELAKYEVGDKLDRLEGSQHGLGRERVGNKVLGGRRERERRVRERRRADNGTPTKERREDPRAGDSPSRESGAGSPRGCPRRR